MDEKRWERYETRRKELHEEYAKKRRKIWIVIIAVIVLCIIGIVVNCLISQSTKQTTIGIFVGFGIAALVFIYGGQRIHFYREQEVTQQNLLQQDEPFGRFRT